MKYTVQVPELQKEIEKLQMNENRLKNQFDRAIQERDAALETVAINRQEVEKVNDLYESVKRERDEERNKNADANKLIETFRRQVQRVSDHNWIVSRERDEEKKEKVAAMEEVEKLKQKVERVTRKRDEEKKEKVAAMDEVEKLKHECKNLEKRYEEIHDNNIRLKNEAEEKQMEKDNLQIQLENVIKERNDEIQINATSKEKVEKLKRKYKNLKKLNIELQEKNTFLKNEADEQLRKSEEMRREIERHVIERRREKLDDFNSAEDQVKLFMEEIHAIHDSEKRLTINRLVRLINCKHFQTSIKHKLEDDRENALRRCKDISTSQDIIVQIKIMRDLKEDLRKLKSHYRLIKSIITGEYYQITNAFSKSILANQDRVEEEPIMEAIFDVIKRLLDQEVLDMNKRIENLKKINIASKISYRKNKEEIENLKNRQISKIRNDVAYLFEIDEAMNNKYQVMLDYIGGIKTDEDLLEFSDDEKNELFNYINSIAQAIEREIDQSANEYLEINSKVRIVITQGHIRR